MAFPCGAEPEFLDDDAEPPLVSVWGVGVEEVEVLMDEHALFGVDFCCVVEVSGEA